MTDLGHVASSLAPGLPPTSEFERRQLTPSARPSEVAYVSVNPRAPNRAPSPTLSTAFPTTSSAHEVSQRLHPTPLTNLPPARPFRGGEGSRCTSRSVGDRWLSDRVVPRRHRVRSPADGGAACRRDAEVMSAERVYRPRLHCRLHLYHRWRTYRSDTGKDSGNPDYGERDDRHDRHAATCRPARPR